MQQLSQEIEQKTKVHFYLFINTKSGGEKGKQYLTLAQNKNKHTFQDQQKRIINVYLIDLFDAKKKEEGLRDIQSKIQKNQQKQKKYQHIIRAIVCGGDGTVLWVVSEVAHFGIDLTKIVFGIIPIGTGNDFSRCLGWGGSPINFSLNKTEELKNLILEWLDGFVSDYDIWQVRIRTYDNGTIMNIRNKQQIDTNSQEFSRYFSNYVGIGIDARISYSVEKHRQSYKCMNLLLYFFLGLFKACKKIKKVDQIVEKFSQNASQNNEEDQDSLQQGPQTYRSLQRTGKALEKGMPAENLENFIPTIQFKEGYGGLLCLNSTTYMAGIKNVWNTNKTAIKNPNPQQLFAEQKIDDGMVQFLAFKSQLRLGLETLCNCGAKITQGEGPFLIKFKKQKKDESLFIQIDGEAIQIVNIKDILIKKSLNIPNGKIKVLRKKVEK